MNSEQGTVNSEWWVYYNGRRRQGQGFRVENVKNPVVRSAIMGLVEPGSDGV